MIYEEAMLTAKNLIDGFNKVRTEAQGKLVLLEEETIHHNLGWVFFYNLENTFDKDNHYIGLVGNSPIFVLKEGRVARLPTAIPVEQALDELTTSGTILGKPIEIFIK